MTWLVDPPGGASNHTFQPKYFVTKEEAMNVAATYPPHTRVIHLEGLEEPVSMAESNAVHTASSICTEAARLVGGNRAVAHGDPAINFRNTAHLWNGFLAVKRQRDGADAPLNAHDVGCLLELLKIARRYCGSFNIDDYVDAAGYAGCAGEIAAATDWH